MKFVFVPAEDASVDSEYQLINDDGTPTNISIQDCRSYGGGWSVNQHGDDWMKMLGEAKSLQKAKELAIAAVEH